jgi:4-methyl-5(b-hydroxyethyl)-thiazole monophosphate biosynthesis
MKKVLLFLNQGFETMEFSPFVDVCGWARNDYQVPITVTTCGFTKVVTSTFDIPVTVDCLIDTVNVADYDALAIPGGFEEFGFYETAYSAAFLALIRQFHAAHKWIASVCVGALPVGKSGILTGHRGTTYHLQGGKRQQQLAAFGVEVVNQPVVIDQQVITSYCPQTAAEVAFCLLEQLTDATTATTLRQAMGY